MFKLAWVFLEWVGEPSAASVCSHSSAHLSQIFSYGLGVSPYRGWLSCGVNGVSHITRALPT